MIKRPFGTSSEQNLSTKESQISTSNSSSKINKKTPQTNKAKVSTKSNLELNKTKTNSTLFSLQTLTFLFVCSDNVVIILDPFAYLDELFSLLLTAIMIVGRPTAMLCFYIPESYLENIFDTTNLLSSLQKRLDKHFESKASFTLLTTLESLSITLNQQKICRSSALIDYKSEASWLSSAHRYWTNIDIPGNLLYQYSSEHERIFLCDEDKPKQTLCSVIDKHETKTIKVQSKNKSSKSEIDSGGGGGGGGVGVGGDSGNKNKTKKNSWGRGRGSSAGGGSSSAKFRGKNVSK